MNLSEIQWKQKGKRRYRLHGMFPYQPEVVRRDDLRIEGEPTYEVHINTHVVAVNLRSFEAAKRHTEDWLFSAMGNLANAFSAFIQRERNLEFSNEQHVGPRG